MRQETQWHSQATASNAMWRFSFLNRLNTRSFQCPKGVWNHFPSSLPPRTLPHLLSYRGLGFWNSNIAPSLLLGYTFLRKWIWNVPGNSARGTKNCREKNLLTFQNAALTFGQDCLKNRHHSHANIIIIDLLSVHYWYWVLTLHMFYRLNISN